MQQSLLLTCICSLQVEMDLSVLIQILVRYFTVLQGNASFQFHKGGPLDLKPSHPRTEKSLQGSSHRTVLRLLLNMLWR